MTALLSRLIARAPAVAAGLYGALVLVLLFASMSAAMDIVNRRASLAESSDLLAQLRARTGAIPNTPLAADRAGSPFLEGPTVTVAGAALLQRVAAAVQGAGGSVQSSSVDVAGDAAQVGLVSLLVSCDLEQAALQTVLYDIEAGMPFLFVDQLDIQAAQSGASDDAPQRLRVMIGVSGRWSVPP